MARKNLSTEILNKYFKNKKVNINIAAAETGISKPTISRYIRSKGFNNYSEFLYGLNKQNNDKEFEETLRLPRYKKYYVSSSKSSVLLKWYLLTKLNSLGYEAEELEGRIEKDSVIIFISLSGSSRSLEKIVEEYKNKIICISTIKPIIKSKNLETLVISEANFGRRNEKEIMNSMDGLLKWMIQEIK